MVCKACLVEKPIECFSKREYGYRKECKPCRVKQAMTYEAKHRKRQPKDIGDMRRCGSCKELRVRTDNFYLSVHGNYETTCKYCRRRLTKESQARHGNNQQAKRKQRYKENPELAIKAKIGWKYGMTIEQYRTMYELQDGKCAICLMPGPYSGRGRLHVDHCHKTKKVRGPPMRVLQSWDWKSTRRSSADAQSD